MATSIFAEINKVEAFWEGHKIFSLLVLALHNNVKTKKEISSNCVVFSEYMTFKVQEN